MGAHHVCVGVGAHHVCVGVDVRVRVRVRVWARQSMVTSRSFIARRTCTCSQVLPLHNVRLLQVATCYVSLYVYCLPWVAADRPLLACVVAGLRQGVMSHAASTTAHALDANPTVSTPHHSSH